MQTRDSRRPTRRRRLADPAADSSSSGAAALARMRAARLAAAPAPIARAKARRLARRPHDAEETNAVVALVERTILGAAADTTMETNTDTEAPAVEAVESPEASPAPRVERARRRTARSARPGAPTAAPAPVEAERPEAEPETETEVEPETDLEAAPRPARIIKRRDDRRRVEAPEPVAPAARLAGTPPGAFSRRRDRLAPAAEGARITDRERPAARRSAQLAAERLFSAPARPKAEAPAPSRPAPSRPAPRQGAPRRAELRAAPSRDPEGFTDPRDAAASEENDPFGGLR